MANRYWVGGSGTWDTASTVNWSATSGGAGGASAPTSTDGVFFNGNSGSGVCYWLHIRGDWYEYLYLACNAMIIYAK